VSVSQVSSTPPAIRATPAITSGILAPRAATIRPASGAQTAIVTAIGSRKSPAASGLYPRTSCRYKVLRNKKPPIAANAVTAVAVAPENGALRKNLGSMSGSSRRSSQARKMISAARARLKKNRIFAEVQPEPGPSMIA